MPSYEELVIALRTLVQANHLVLGQEDFQPSREVTKLLLAMSEAQRVLAELQPKPEAQQAAREPEENVIAL